MLKLSTYQDLQNCLIKLDNEPSPTDEEVEALESLRYVLLFTGKQFIMFFSVLVGITFSLALNEIIVTGNAMLKYASICLLTFSFICIWNYIYKIFCLLSLGMPFLKWYKIQKKTNVF